MAKPKIGRVTVVYPSTPEGMAALEERFAQFNTRLLECFLDQINAPEDAKLAYVESLNGIAPWAKSGGEAGNDDFQAATRMNLDRRNRAVRNRINETDVFD